MKKTSQPVNSLHVSEVLKIKTERKEKYNQVIKDIMEKIHSRIISNAKLKRDNCVYTIPRIINDLHLFDLEYVTKEVYTKLNEEGYIVSAYSNGTIMINWNEDLLKHKKRTEQFLLQMDTKNAKKIDKINKKIDQEYSFLANPLKITAPQKTADDLVNEQINKILAERETEQNKYKNKLSNRNN